MNKNTFKRTEIFFDGMNGNMWLRSINNWNFLLSPNYYSLSSFIKGWYVIAEKKVKNWIFDKIEVSLIDYKWNIIIDKCENISISKNYSGAFVFRKDGREWISDYKWNILMENIFQQITEINSEWSFLYTDFSDNMYLEETKTWKITDWKVFLK